MNQDFLDEYNRLAALYGGRPDFIRNVWDKTEATEGNAIARKRIEKCSFQEGRGLFFYGPAGTGKTHFLKCLFNELVFWKVKQSLDNNSAGGHPYWIKLSNYLEDLRGDAKQKRRAIEAKWLFIDDLGTSTTTDWSVDQVFQLLDERLEANRQTFITSNFDLEAIAKMYHERVSSRIAAHCLPIGLGGKDRRLLSLSEDLLKK